MIRLTGLKEREACMAILDMLTLPGLEEMCRARPGETIVLSGISGTLAAVAACLAAGRGRRVHWWRTTT